MPSCSACSSSPSIPICTALCLYGSIKLWPYIVMALCSYGPYTVAAFYSYGRIQLWPIELWPYIAIAVYSYVAVYTYGAI